jgi:hypothetical protein
LLGAAIIVLGTPRRAWADGLLAQWRYRLGCADGYGGCGEEPPSLEVGGTWYWLRSPEEERRVAVGLFSRYCIRCHATDGRGTWDIPDVPNFTNPRWQAVHTDGQLARSILEGRGSVMPAWRGPISLEEAWALARYIRTLVPGTEPSRPDFSAPEKPAATPQPTAPEKKTETAMPEKKPARP